MVLYQSGFSRVTELMSSLYIVKEFIDDLQSAVHLPTMVSSSCEWKSKDLAVAQSHRASKQKSILPMSLYGLQQKVQPRLKVCATTPLIPDGLELEELPVFKISIPRSRSETSISQHIRVTGEPSNSGLYFIPDIVKLTTRNSHYRHQGNMDHESTKQSLVFLWKS